VLRLRAGEEIELFDDTGNVAIAKIDQIDSTGVVALVHQMDVKLAVASGVSLTIASAVPKGDRADWMIEKLSELGVTRFIPLITARSVVAPKGMNKLERWQRIALQSAKQSRRVGTLQIDQPTTLKDTIGSLSAKRYFLSTETDASPIARSLGSSAPIALLIGPEGGWTEAEIESMRAANMRGLILTSTILRVETAAIAAAAIASVLLVRAK
jgi:16S rRNA (uracil1498-N3)-methyltransferase